MFVCVCVGVCVWGGCVCVEQVHICLLYKCACIIYICGIYAGTFISVCQHVHIECS